MTDMTPQEAYEVLLLLGKREVQRHDKEQFEEIVPFSAIPMALAVLRAHHAYFSRFKPGDYVWYVFQPDKEWLVGEGVLKAICYNKNDTLLMIGTDIGKFPMHCFPTRAEAEAECERRNRDA